MRKVIFRCLPSTSAHAFNLLINRSLLRTILSSCATALLLSFISITSYAVRRVSLCLMVSTMAKLESMHSISIVYGFWSPLRPIHAVGDNFNSGRNNDIIDLLNLKHSIGTLKRLIFHVLGDFPWKTVPPGLADRVFLALESSLRLGAFVPQICDRE